MKSNILHNQIYWQLIGNIRSSIIDDYPFGIADYFLADEKLMIFLKSKLLKSVVYPKLKSLIVKILVTKNYVKDNETIINAADVAFQSSKYRLALILYNLAYFFDDNSLDTYSWSLKGIARTLYYGYGKDSSFIEVLKASEPDLFERTE